MILPIFGNMGLRLEGLLMAKNTSIALGDHFEHFVGQQVAGGQYGSVSEVVRAGLRLLEEREMRLAALRQALEEGEQSGEGVPFDVEAFLTERAAEQTE